MTEKEGGNDRKRGRNNKNKGGNDRVKITQNSSAGWRSQLADQKLNLTICGVIKDEINFKYF
ncbi:MAG: hypothetical protein N2593_01840 [Patescibacteria group bacterium]|nr:hypothetical protein [Patescibacteria group bacterium]